MYTNTEGAGGRSELEHRWNADLDPKPSFLCSSQKPSSVAQACCYMF